jgi:hypothetical protein
VDKTTNNSHTKMPFEIRGRYLSIYQSMWFGIKIKVSKRRIKEQLKLIYELKLNGGRKLMDILRYPI